MGVKGMTRNPAFAVAIKAISAVSHRGHGGHRENLGSGGRVGCYKCDVFHHGEGGAWERGSVGGTPEGESGREGEWGLTPSPSPHPSPSFRLKEVLVGTMFLLGHLDTCILRYSLTRNPASKNG